MKTIKINRYQVGQRALAEAAAVLLDGGVVAFPTETAYGLAADSRNPKALERIYRMKGRSVEKMLPLVAASKEQVGLYFALNKAFSRLANQYWPGPLTMVLLTRKKTALASWKDVAVRVPSAVWARSLPEIIGHPITSTSANRSGQSNCYSASAVRRTFRGQAVRPDLLLDAGPLPKREPSTIIKSERGRLVVLRQGIIKVK